MSPKDVYLGEQIIQNMRSALKFSIIALLFPLLVGFQENVPELNQKIVVYVNSVMGKKVDRGECWDLAAGALEKSEAYFDRSTKQSAMIYGRRVDPNKEEIFPGDLIQFENVKCEWKVGNSTYAESMMQHTAIVYKVNGQGDYQIAHQNTGSWGKKVGVSQFVLSRVKSGKVMIYRPVKTEEEMK
jgi:hypothetical protein